MFCFKREDWLRSLVMFLSYQLAALRSFDSVWRLGCSPSTCFDPVEWIRSEKLILSSNLAAFID